MAREERFRIRLSSTGGSEIARDAQRAARGFQPIVKEARSVSTTSRTAGRDVDHLGRELTTAGSRARGYGREVKSADTSTSHLGRTTEHTGRGLLRAAKWAAGAAAAYLSISQAKTAIDNTEELAKVTAGLSRNLGLSSKEASRWGAVAHAREIDSKSLTMSFTTLSRKVQDVVAGSDTAANSFKLLGISQGEVKRQAGDFPQLLQILADRFGALDGTTRRQAAAQQLLGRGYATILPLFSDGAKGLQEQLHWADKYGVALDDVANDKLMALVQSQRESRVATLGLQVAFTKLVTPVLEDVEATFQRVVEIINDPDLSAGEKWHKVSRILEGLADDALDAFTEVLPQIADKAGEFAPKIASALVSGFLHADAWGKLALAGWLLTKFGGIGAFTSIGRRGGAALGAGMAETAALGAGAPSARGGLLKAGRIAGTAMAAAGGIAFIGGLATTISDGVRTMPGDSGLQLAIQDFGINAGRQLGINFGDTSAEHYEKEFTKAIHRLAMGKVDLAGQIRFDPAGFLALKPDERRLAAIVGTTRDELERAFRGWSGRKIALTRFIEADPQGARQFADRWLKGIDVLRSGVLHKWSDIRKVFHDNQRLIESDPNLSGKNLRTVVERNYGEAANAIIQAANHGYIGQKRAVALQRQLWVQMSLDTGKNMTQLAGIWAKGWDHVGSVTERDLDKILKRMDKLPPGARDRMGDALVAMARAARQKGDLPEGAVEELIRKLAVKFHILPKKATPPVVDMAGDVASIFSLLADRGVAPALEAILGNVSSALSKLGVKKEITWGAELLGGAALGLITGGGRGKRQARGGMVTVPGSGRQDSVPLRADAIVAPGEELHVVNRHQRPALDYAVAKTYGVKGMPGFYQQFDRPHNMAKGGVVGGLDFALGPYEIPPIHYAADHAGANSHVHISGTTIPWVIAIGHQLQSMGFDVGEFAGPASAGFGPITTDAHAHYTHDHYSGYAIDVNSPTHPQETRAEVARIAKILGGQGIPGGAAIKIAEAIVTGPDGPLKDLGQAAVDKVHGAAQKYAEAQAPATTGMGTGAEVEVGPGSLSRAEMRKLLAAHGMPNWTGWIAMAESLLNPKARSYADARGLFQVLESVWGGGDRLYDPNFNVAMARKILTEQGLSAWAPSEHAGAIPEGWGPHKGQRFARGGMPLFVGDSIGVGMQPYLPGGWEDSAKVGRHAAEGVNIVRGLIGRARGSGPVVWELGTNDSPAALRDALGSLSRVTKGQATYLVDTLQSDKGDAGLNAVISEAVQKHSNWAKIGWHDYGKEHHAHPDAMGHLDAGGYKLMANFVADQVRSGGDLTKPGFADAGPPTTPPSSTAGGVGPPTGPGAPFYTPPPPPPLWHPGPLPQSVVGCTLEIHELRQRLNEAKKHLNGLRSIKGDKAHSLKVAITRWEDYVKRIRTRIDEVIKWRGKLLRRQQTQIRRGILRQGELPEFESAINVYHGDNSPVEIAQERALAESDLEPSDSTLDDGKAVNPEWLGWTSRVATLWQTKLGSEWNWRDLLARAEPAAKDRVEHTIDPVIAYIEALLHDKRYRKQRPDLQRRLRDWKASRQRIVGPDAPGGGDALLPFWSSDFIQLQGHGMSHDPVDRGGYFGTGGPWGSYFGYGDIRVDQRSIAGMFDQASDVGRQVQDTLSQASEADASDEAARLQAIVDIQNQLLEQYQKERYVLGLQAPVAAEFVGQYATGTGPAGLPATGLYLGHKGEQVVSVAEQRAAGEPHIETSVSIDFASMTALVDTAVDGILRSSVRKGLAGVPARPQPLGLQAVGG